MSDAKTFEAAERERIYQQGQRAFGANLACPYSAFEWRSKTWWKGYDASRAEYDAMGKECEEAAKKGPCDAFEDWWLMNGDQFTEPKEAARAAWDVSRA